VKVNSASDADISIHFEITPETLREYANLFELSAQRAMPGETITAKFARHGTFSYTMPDVAVEQRPKLKPNSPSVNPLSS
jgi:hypothetical protein